MTLYGAAYEVTGSCYLVETDSARILIDCGMFQGSARLERMNHIPATLKAKTLDAVLLTHGHLDHSGRLPLLIRAGYRGPIYATPGSIDIVTLILNDAAKIQKDDTDRENRQRARNGLGEIKALFDQKDVDRVCAQFRAVDYDDWTILNPSLKARFVEAGHILGSSSIELDLKESGKNKRVVFSGDLGQWNTPIVRDPALIERADLVFVETTYGNRDHRTLEDTVKEFEDLIKEAVEHKGKIFIPTFAVGRAQQILYHLAEIFRKKIVEPFPVYLDSPMAIAATGLYIKHPELMDEEAQNLRASGQLRKDLSTLHTCQSANESKLLNDLAGPCLILAGAGMCNAGRIQHHLKQNLPLPATVVIIVGYQAKGSIGRKLVEGASEVKINGETIHVKARVRGLGGFSAHAGQTDLLRWLESMAKNGARIVLTHGESSAIDEFYHQVKERFQIKAERPKLSESITL